MDNVAEFIQVRQGIESLAKEIAMLVEQKTMPQSKARFDEATELLVKLTAMADNDVQEVAVRPLDEAARQPWNESRGFKAEETGRQKVVRLLRIPWIMQIPGFFLTGCDEDSGNKEALRQLSGLKIPLDLCPIFCHTISRKFTFLP